MSGSAANWKGIAPLVLLALALLTQVAESKGRTRRDKNSHSWNYEDKTGPGYWPMMFKKCAGSRQSPIDIITGEADLNTDLNEFDFENYDETIEHAIIENNGHTVVVKPGSDDEKMSFTEGGVDDEYEFLQLHFHWGSDSKKGAEHTIDGKRFPLEMHLVHKNKNYKSVEQAKNKEDGLAVLGVIFKLDDEDNDDLTPIIDKLDDVRKEGGKADLDDFKLSSLMPDDLMPYYRYRGSLTSPPCSEAVIWTVFEDHVSISEKQLQQFRGVKESDEGEEDESLVDNFRPVQPLNGRIVEVSGESAASAIQVSATTLLFALGFLTMRRYLF